MAVYRWQRLKLTSAIDRFPTQRTDVVCRSTASSVANWITAWWWRTDATPMPQNISSIGQRLNNRQIARRHLRTVWNLLYRLRVIRIGLRVTRLFSTIATSYTVFLTCHSLSPCKNKGHSPAGPGLASTRMSPFWILLELRMMEVVKVKGKGAYTWYSASS